MQSLGISKAGKDERIKSVEIQLLQLYVSIILLLLFQINWNCMKFIDYCISIFYHGNYRDLLQMFIRQQLQNMGMAKAFLPTIYQEYNQKQTSR